jgi:hypothetical protein
MEDLESYLNSKARLKREDESDIKKKLGKAQEHCLLQYSCFT